MAILVVDNSHMIRRIIRKELEGENFEVREADNADDLFRIIIDSPIELITLSVELTGMNGYEISSRINRGEIPGLPPDQPVPRPPIIFITSDDTLEGRRLGFESGATDFITKPFDPGDVAGAVKNVLMPETRLKGLRALIVDDSDMARQIIAGFLSGLGVLVDEADNGLSAFDITKRERERIDLVITDQLMPGLEGHELCFKIRKELNLKDLPVIILSAVSDSVTILELFRSGATDYLMKPFLKEELLGRLMVHLESRLLYRRLEARIKKVDEINRLFKEMATKDPVTTLPNRRNFFDRFMEYLVRRDRENIGVALLILDLDNFKDFNDRHGYHAGDWLLEEVADFIRSLLPSSCYIARIGGDEFAILCRIQEESRAMNLGNAIRKRIAARPFLQDHGLDLKQLTVCIGFETTFPADGKTLVDIFRKASVRLHTAQKKGVNLICCADKKKG